MLRSFRLRCRQHWFCYAAPQHTTLPVTLFVINTRLTLPAYHHEVVTSMVGGVGLLRRYHTMNVNIRANTVIVIEWHWRQYYTPLLDIWHW